MISPQALAIPFWWRLMTIGNDPPRDRRRASGNAAEPSPSRPHSRLEAMVVGHRGELLRFLMARRASQDEADDILQDLFIKVGALEEQSVTAPRAYLFRMASNLLLDRRRTAARRSIREKSWTETQQAAGEMDDRPSIEEEMLARQHVAFMLRAIESLPLRTAEILRRYRIEGEGQRSISRDLGISLSAVEKHLQRAYKAIIAARARLEQEIAESGRFGEHS